MSYYVFHTEQQAAAAEAQIVSNIRAWVSSNLPDALADDGTLRGQNAATGQWAETTTVRWDEPRQISDGRWIIAAPTQQRIAPIPLAVAVEGIEAPTEAATSEWLPQPEEGAE